MRLRFCPSGNSTEHLFFNIFDVGEPTQTSHSQFFADASISTKNSSTNFGLLRYFSRRNAVCKCRVCFYRSFHEKAVPRNRLIQGEGVQGIVDASPITAKSFPLGRPAQLRFRASECDRATTARLSLKSHAPGSPIKSDPR